MAIATPFIVILYLNIEKWAEKHGYDTYLANSKIIEGDVVSQIMEFALRPEMSYIAVTVVAFMAGVWCDVLLRRRESKRTTKTERIIQLGVKCQDLARYIDTCLGAIDYGDQQDSFSRMWSELLPVSNELEKLKIKVPNHGVTSIPEAKSIREYMRFIGNLLQNGQPKIARQTAKRLINGTNPRDGDLLPQ